LVRPLVCPHITSKTGYVAIALRLGFGNNLVLSITYFQFKSFFGVKNQGMIESSCLKKLHHELLTQHRFNQFRFVLIPTTHFACKQKNKEASGFAI
jgi:hypothetical protein